MDLKKEIVGHTFLFDLDGTLLPMDTKAFEKAYFIGLSKRLSSIVDFETLYHLIWEGTKQMVLNDGRQTNKEAFRRYLNNHTALNYDRYEDLFMDYYANEFQDCINACRISDLSRKIIDTLQSKGYEVAIATNPIFPQLATYSRLRWLTIDPSRFSLVTTFENSHYAKPNPAYYQEVCERLQVDPRSCIMVGNDVIEDGAAAKLGMQVMLIEDCLLHEDQLSKTAFTTTRLADFYEWCRQLPSLLG